MARVSFDSSMMEAIDDHRVAWATSAAKAVMTLGTTHQVLVGFALVAAVVVVLLGAYRPAMAAVAALVVAAVVSVALKHIFDRGRPPAHLIVAGATGPSFPSTHAAVTSAIAVAILVATPWRTSREARTAAFLLAVLVAVVGGCMVYLGAHWPTDVLAGWLLGGTIGWAAGLPSRRRRRARDLDGPAPDRLLDDGKPAHHE